MIFCSVLAEMDQTDALCVSHGAPRIALNDVIGRGCQTLTAPAPVDRSISTGLSPRRGRKMPGCRALASRIEREQVARPVLVVRSHVDIDACRRDAGMTRGVPHLSQRPPACQRLQQHLSQRDKVFGAT